MITVLSKFQLKSPMELAEATDRFIKSAEKYALIPGLIRKDFTISEDGRTLIGIYLWESKEAALALYTDEWKARQEANTGVKCELVWHKCMAVADGLRKVALTSY